jgi:large subunit ribosomal protein L15
MQLNQLQQETRRERPKRIGRGGTRGKTSGRGMKGQKARAGHSLRPEIRDMIKKLPKRRGHGKNRSRTVNSGRVQPAIVNLDSIDERRELISVTPGTLLKAGLVRRRGGKMPPVKILGRGMISRAVTVERCILSQTVREKMEAAGGTLLEPAQNLIAR